MRTHRELRDYDKMKKIISFLKPLIEVADELEMEDIKGIQMRQAHEQKAMAELRE